MLPREDKGYCFGPAVGVTDAVVTPGARWLSNLTDLRRLRKEMTVTHRQGFSVSKSLTATVEVNMVGAAELGDCRRERKQFMRGEGSRDRLTVWRLARDDADRNAPAESI